MSFLPDAGRVAQKRAGRTIRTTRESALRAGLCGLTLGLSARAEPSFFLARVAPILDLHCVVCHGSDKQKAGLRVDTWKHLRQGAESGSVIEPGDPKGSELLRRITLPADEEEVMPSDGKPLLSANEIKIIELWIAAGASETQPLSAFPSAPAPKPRAAAVVAFAPDWRTRAAEIEALEKELGIRLAPRSQRATDGLVLRTASSPARCDDAALAKLAPVADLIVEAELARTSVTDVGLRAIGSWENLRTMDLTRTRISSAGLSALVGLRQLEVLNLTNTRVDDAGLASLRSLPALKRVWVFGTQVKSAELPGKIVTR